MVLFKRIPRLFREELFRNLMLMILMIVGMSVVLGGAIGNAAIINTNQDVRNVSALESGNFTLFDKANNETLKKIEDKDVLVEEQFYYDLDAGEGRTLRVFKNREKIDLIHFYSGEKASNEDEIVLEEHYAEKHSYEIGDTITISGKNFEITGICCAPDYTYVKKNPSDLNSNPEKFSIAFVDESAFSKFEGTSVYSYAYILGNNAANKDVRKILSDSEQLQTFLIQENNTRITAYEDDCSLMKNASLITGIVFMVLIAYILTIFVKSIVENEKAVIGTLYAMGYLRGELIRMYMLLPVMLVLISSIISILLGYFVTSDLLAEDSIALYSMPTLQKTISPGIILYGLIMPLCVTVLVNYITLRKNLNRKPIDLLRRAQRKTMHTSGKFRKMPFFAVFRIREFLSEIGSNVILCIGIFVATLLLVLGFTIESGMNYYVEHVSDEIGYKYEYTLKQFPEEVPEGAETILQKSLHYSEGDMDIFMVGISEDSKYFNITASKKTDEMTVSDAFAKKYELAVGDTVKLKDILNDKEYSLKIDSIVPYSYGLCVFQNIDTMRSTFDSNKNFYTGIISDHKLSLDSDMILSVTTEDDVIDAAKLLSNNMQMMMLLMEGMGLIVFAAVIFLIVRILIGKSAFSISLIKIFGYNQHEINQVYLGVPLIVTLISCVVSVPLCSKIVQKIYPYLTKDLPAYFIGTLDLRMDLYLVAYMLIMYLIVNLFLMRQTNKISLSEVIKERE